MENNEFTVQRKGCTLHYWLSGAADGPVIVFTHGASADHHMFDAQKAVLEKDYRVLTWDMRGHGQSRPMGDAFTVPEVVEDLLAILDKAGIQQAIFAGQSTGGYVHQELVFRRPERVTALVMIDCICITFKLSSMDAFLLKLTPAILKLYPYNVLLKQASGQSAVTPAVQQYLYDTSALLTKDDYVTVLTGAANSIHDEPGYRITHPMLLVHGEHDRLGNIAKDAPKWAARDPNCKYVVIPNAGHCSNQDNPEFFNRTLLEWLRTLNMEAE